MTVHTHLLRRGIRAALAVTAVASIAIVGVACTQTEPGGGETSTPSTSGGSTGKTDSAADASDSSDASGSDANNSQQGSASTAAEAGGPGGTQLLDKTMSGQEAIDALGDDIGIVAKRAGKSVDELKELLLKNKSAHVSKTGDLFYKDSFEN